MMSKINLQVLGEEKQLLTHSPEVAPIRVNPCIKGDKEMQGMGGGERV